MTFKLKLTVPSIPPHTRVLRRHTHSDFEPRRNFRRGFQVPDPGCNPLRQPNQEIPQSHLAQFLRHDRRVGGQRCKYGRVGKEA